MILFYLLIISFSSIFCEIEEFEHHLATKTAYRFVANYDTTEIEYEGCTPKQIWAVIRHGTRNPEEDEIDDMLTKLPKIRNKILDAIPDGTDEINATIISMFNAWSSEVDADDVELLTAEGEEELFLLAQRFQKRFPTLLDQDYTDTSFKFKYTNTERTEKSCKSFADGLFGEEVTASINFPQPLNPDPILEFFELCKKWNEDVNDNKDASQEKEDFQDGDESKAVIKGVNNRLGLDKKELDFGDLNAMYKTCAFETAWHKDQKSPWCAIFTNDDFKILEYEKDLKHYWLDGYGYELTYKQACVVIEDLVDFFQSDKASVNLYFTHSGSLLKILFYMGLYKDEKPLYSNNYLESLDRKFKVSYIDTFANNLFFVKFDCQGEEKVLTLHQEQIVRLPSCPDTDLCNFDTFVDYYAKSECLFDEMCENNK